MYQSTILNWLARLKYDKHANNLLSNIVNKMKLTSKIHYVVERCTNTSKNIFEGRKCQIKK